MRLVEAEINKNYKIINMHLLGQRVRTRITDMGLIDCSFKVVVKQNKGPVLIELRGTRLALGRGIAEKILVEEIK